MTATARKHHVSRKPTAFCYDSDSFEVMERVSDRDWKVKFPAWQKSIQAAHKRGSYFRPCTPSPMPWGHIMFTGGCAYVRCDTPPTPVWSDGVACLYAGQKVGWCDRTPGKAPWGSWHYGRVVKVEKVDGVDMLTVNTAGCYLQDREELITVPLSVLEG